MFELDERTDTCSCYIDQSCGERVTCSNCEVALWIHEDRFGDPRAEACWECGNVVPITSIYWFYTGPLNEYPCCADCVVVEEVEHVH